MSEIIVWSPDTDVALLCVHFCLQIGAELWFRTGKGKDDRYICINRLVQKLGPEVCNGMLALHCLTGCDSTSYLSGRGRGKGEALKYYLKEYNKYGPMKHLGDTIDLPHDVEVSAADFVGALYSKSIPVQNGDLNALWYALFVQPGKEMLLPPTSDSFHQHALRVNYSAYLGKHALVLANVPSPVGHGWVEENGKLEVVFMTEQPAPFSLAELIRCGCKTPCVRNSCSCRKSSLPCTASCKCAIDGGECHNPNTCNADCD